MKYIHFIGIKGVGMAALAIMAKERGLKVTGSDVEEIFVTDKLLKDFGIKWKRGFGAENIEGRPDLVVVTGAHGGKNNPEARAAEKMGLPVLMHAQALGAFMEGCEGISVCGVGGKSTTAAMIATVLSKAGLDPSFAVGVGSISPLGAPGHWGKGKYFVAEADEYVTCPETDPTPRFLYQSPKIIVVTNIEYDHPDVYPSLEETKKAFLQFAERLPADGSVVACLDNPNVRAWLPSVRREKVTYGFSKDAKVKILAVEFEEGRTVFEIEGQGKFVLQVPGRYNALNATAAVIVASSLGVGLEKIKEGLFAFRGTKRRFEFIGKRDGVRLYDDYAHHPLEIEGTLKAAREWFPDAKLIVVFQPHTYSRTRALLSEFARCFSGADKVIISDIYSSAREKEDSEISSKILVENVGKHHGDVKYIGDPRAAVAHAAEAAEPGDVIMTMGAGDIFHYLRGLNP